jgi:hypothetical protein
VLRLTAIPNSFSCPAIFWVVFLVHLTPLIGSPAVSFSGSQQEFVRSGILRGFLHILKSDILSVGHSHAFCLQ